MKSLKLLVCILIISVMFIGCSNQNSTVSTDTEKNSVVVTSEKKSSESEKSVKESKYNFYDYLELIGLSKEELLNKFDEQPVSLDENFESFSRETFGLDFPKTSIRVWFSDYGNGPIDQIYISDKTLDIKGSKVGDNISTFKKSFGDPLEAKTVSSYINFEYNNKILSVYYDLKTQETYGLYIIDNSQYSSEYIERKNSRYDVAGIKDPITFEKTFNAVKNFVAEGNKEKVADYILYPMNIFEKPGEVKLEIKNKEDFIKNYDKIITGKVKNAFINQKVEETFVNCQGVMVNNGEIWFGATRANDSTPWKYVIIAINNN